MSVGVPELDDQHQQLLSIINELIDHQHETIHSETVSSSFGKLVAYTKQHFALEEDWMRQNGYPRLHEHRAQHVQFTENLVDMMLALDQISMHDLITFLTAWFDNHIRHDDQDYAAFFARSDIR
jgi:hemerythrin-like metal-binding protein